MTVAYAACQEDSFTILTYDWILRIRYQEIASVGGVVNSLTSYMGDIASRRGSWYMSSNPNRFKLGVLSTSLLSHVMSSNPSRVELGVLSPSVLSRRVIDGRVVRAGVSVTWNVLSWSGGHEFEPWSGRTWGTLYFCPKSYSNQTYLMLEVRRTYYLIPATISLRAQSWRPTVCYYWCCCCSVPIAIDMAIRPWSLR